MKVLILTSLFHPEIAANAKRMTHLAEELRDKGHDVTVITAFPHYPTSTESDKYKDKLLVGDHYDSIPVIRTYAYTPDSYKNLLKRALSFLSFMISSIFGAFKIPGKIDVVVTISPPFFSLFSGYIISRLKRAMLILDIQDIYPETLTALDLLKNKIAISFLEWLERFFYRKAKGMVGISEGFREDFIRKGAAPQSTGVVYNWADTEHFQPRDGYEIRKQYKLEDKFIVMFLGNLGFCQGLEHVIEAAQLLQQHKDKIEFIFLGEGVEKEKLKELAGKYHLPNITFIPSQPNSKIPQFLSMADTCLVHLKKRDLFHITIPCKIYEYMAMEKPIIVGAKGEALQHVAEGECGIGIEPESPKDIANAIQHLYENRSKAQEMGKRGREYLLHNFTKEKMLSKYINFIETIATKGR